MTVRILRLNKSGLPTAWLSQEEAATLYVKQHIIWTLGEEPFILRGGTNRQGQRSILQIHPIIACRDEVSQPNFIPSLNNRLLFRRDEHHCLYCGYQYPDALLTRDHIVPRVQGGRDSWSNVVTACQRCNHAKGGRTPEQAQMQLLAIPFTPNRFEFMYLANRQILGDQMAYLRARFTGHRQWHAA